MTTTENNCKFCLLIHGGAGVISKELDPTPYHTVLQRILIASYNFGKSEKCLSALDLAEFAVKELENEPLFNAGKGAVYTNSGTHELEASIMDGQTLKCGTVSMITKMKNPVSVARLVMERTDHISIIGETAEKIGIEAGLEVVDQTYYDTPHRYQQLVAAKQSAGVYNDHDLLTFRDRTNKNSSGEGATGTVGCVCAFDGNVACATSTGGMS